MKYYIILYHIILFYITLHYITLHAASDFLDLPFCVSET
jgi:hypothetical protein